MYPKAILPGFQVPLHRSLTDVVLLGGAPRSFAIANGTCAAAISLGLRLWLTGLLIWMIGHALAVLAAKKDPQFMDVLSRHVRHKGFLSC